LRFFSTVSRSICRLKLRVKAISSAPIFRFCQLKSRTCGRVRSPLQNNSRVMMANPTMKDRARRSSGRRVRGITGDFRFWILDFGFLTSCINTNHTQSTCRGAPRGYPRVKELVILLTCERYNSHLAPELKY
jgi:hypothetical protein